MNARTRDSTQFAFRLVASAIALVTCWSVLAAGATPGPDKPPTPKAKVQENGCQACHTCAEPTHDEKCLRVCARTDDGVVNREMAEKHGPEFVLLDELVDRYLPVPFDHKGHAGMAEMSTGCATCHHFTPKGLAHPACNTCHEVSSAREDIRKPGLVGAYHRQCMGCHREWDHDAKCNVCHPPRTQVPGDGPPAPLPNKDDLLGGMHPPIPEPHIEIYKTQLNTPAETQVIFRHEEHVHRFGLKCVECHKGDSCMRCHEQGKTHVQKVRTFEEHHSPCSTCHDMSETGNHCERCHWKDGQPKPPPFNHAKTGWPLSRHHVNLSCRVCHTTVPFVGAKRDCIGCHTTWSPDTFNHDLTGQRLDETHRDVDCEECHIDGQYQDRPTCDECHDEDQGYKLPNKRPGPLMEPVGLP